MLFSLVSPLTQILVWKNVAIDMDLDAALAKKFKWAGSRKLQAASAIDSWSRIV